MKTPDESLAFRLKRLAKLRARVAALKRKLRMRK